MGDICSLTCQVLGKDMNVLAATKISIRGVRMMMVVRVEIPATCTEENPEQIRDGITRQGEGILPDTAVILGSGGTDGLTAAETEFL